MKGKLIFSSLFALWLCLLVYLSGVPHLFSGTSDWLTRKLGHTAAYGILTYLLWKSLCYFTRKLHLRLSFCITTVLVLAMYDEIHQMSIPGRHGNYKGLLFDILGMALVLYYQILIKQKHTTQSTDN